MITEEQVRNQLKTVIDPEMQLDIVSMGLIYEIRIDEQKGKRVKGQKGCGVYILMTLTSPVCPLAETIEEMVISAAKKVEGVKEVNIELTFDPPWNMDKMTEEAKAELGFF